MQCEAAECDTGLANFEEPSSACIGTRMNIECNHLTILIYYKRKGNVSAGYLLIRSVHDKSKECKEAVRGRRCANLRVENEMIRACVGMEKYNMF